MVENDQIGRRHPQNSDDGEGQVRQKRAKYITKNHQQLGNRLTELSPIYRTPHQLQDTPMVQTQGNLGFRCRNRLTDGIGH
ncbi:hypothetical protein BGX30_011154, partial [Mortierella sp. GBA39]